MALTTAQAVEKAIRIAQDAVKADEAGTLEEAIALYTQSVDLISLGLQNQSASEEVDNTVLHKYKKLYADRIDELHRSLLADAAAESAAAATDGLPPNSPSDFVPGAPASATDWANGGGAGSSFSFDEVELKGALPPEPAPSGADEWRRPFWLMRVLKTSMQSGGYLTPDGRVFVPSRIWVQKGARFIGLAAKIECCQLLVSELQRAASVDFRSAPALQKELERLDETLDALQNSLHRVLPVVPEPKVSQDQLPSHAISKLTERFKGFGRVLDKTAARLASLPTKCNDPTEYVLALTQLFDAAAVVETWVAHYTRTPPPSDASLVAERLHRCAAFLYEVVCAFVLQDLDGLLQRHMRKALNGLVKGPANE